MAVGFIFQIPQKEVHIRITVVGVAGTEELGIASGMDSGSAVQRPHFQPRIIGKTIQPVVLFHVAGLLQGVALQRLCRLRNILMAANICESHHFEAVAQDLPYFLQFVGIVGCKNYLHAT